MTWSRSFNLIAFWCQMWHIGKTFKGNNIWHVLTWILSVLNSFSCWISAPMWWLKWLVEQIPNALFLHHTNWPHNWVTNMSWHDRVNSGRRKFLEPHGSRMLHEPTTQPCEYCRNDYFFPHSHRKLHDLDTQSCPLFFIIVLIFIKSFRTILIHTRVNLKTS